MTIAVGPTLAVYAVILLVVAIVVAAIVSLVRRGR
jgi:hypothetical protein